MSSKNQERLDKLRKQHEELKAQIALLQARANAEERKKDTRRKILVGGLILAKVRQGEWPEAKLLAMLDQALTRADDRALFGLLPKEDEAAMSEAKATEAKPDAETPASQAAG